MIILKKTPIERELRRFLRPPNTAALFIQILERLANGFVEDEEGDGGEEGDVEEISLILAVNANNMRQETACLFRLIPLFLIPIVNLLPLLFDLLRSAATPSRSGSGSSRKMISSKDLSFVGYTYKNFDAVKGLHSSLDCKGSASPKRPSLDAIFTNDDISPSMGHIGIK